VKVSGNENVKLAFCSLSSLNVVRFSQKKTKMIIGPFYTCHRIHFTSGNASSWWYL